MSKLLIVDDEEKIVEVLKEYAVFNGYEVDTASNGKEAIEKALKTNYDCMLIDIMMPEMNGYDAVKEIKKDKNLPTIMVSARSEEYDKLLGFDLGIDDYIVKPFSPKEVMARVKAIIKRYSLNTEIVTEAELTVDLGARIVTLCGERINLTNKEYDLLVFLVKNKNIALTRDKILKEVWGYDYFGDGRTVDTHIKMLRSHLNDFGGRIKTIHGVGYKLEI